MEFAQRAVSLEPANPVLLHELAAALWAAGLLREAIDAQRRALERYTQEEQFGPLAPWAKGRELGELMPEAFVRVPKAQLHFQLGRLLDAASDQAGAEKAFQEAIVADPARPEFYHELFHVLGRSGRAEEAEACKKEAIQHAWKFAKRIPRSILSVPGRESETLERYQLLVYLLWRLDEPEEAQRAACEAVARFPKNAGSYFILSTAYQRSSLFEKAIDAARQGLLIAPGDSRLLALLGSLLADHRVAEEAEPVLRQALADQPGDTTIRCLLARVLEKGGKCAEALDLVKESAESDSENAAVFNELGHLAANLGNLEEAQQAQNRAVRLDPNNGHFWWQMGSILERRGRYEEALESLRRARLLLPGTPDLISFEGLVLLENASPKKQK